MKSLISFSTLIGLATCITFGSYDSSLDPGRITWPQEKWCNNPIEVSQANAESYITFTFHFRTFTAVPISSAIVQVIYPASWSSVTSPGTLNPTGAITVGDVTYTTSAKVQLPSISGSSAVLGPFGLVTRSSSTGQIIDVNYVFGCIAYTKSKSSVTNAGGLIVTSNGIKSIKGSDILSFTFLISQSLWKHDIIEIAPATDWIPSSSLTCASVNEVGTTVLSGYNGQSMHCGIADSSSPYPVTNADTAGNSVYIYGLDQDAYFNGTAMKLKFSVSSFILPSYVQTSSSNSWTLKIWRWGTTSLIAKYTASSGPVDMTAGTISVSSWVPVSKIQKSAVVSGMVIFTVASVTTSNALNGGGSIVINFSGVSVNSNYWWADLDGYTDASSTTLCYVAPYISGASCSATGSAQVTLTFTSTQVAGTFQVYTLTQFTSNFASISSISSTNSNSKSVDAMSISTAWTLSATNSRMTDCFFHGYNTATYPRPDSLNLGTIMGGRYQEFLYFRLKPNSSTSWGRDASTTLSLNIPIAQNAISFNSILIGGGAAPSIYQAIDPLTDNWGITLSYSTALVGTPTISSTGITVNIPLGTSQLTNANYLILAYYGYGTTSTGALTSLPYVASNVATFYEMWAQVTSPSEIGSNVFSVLPQRSASIYTAPLCTTQGSGIPIENLFTALNMDFDFASTSYNFAIDIIIGGTSASYSDNDGFMGTSIKIGTLASGTFYSSASITPDIKISTYTDYNSVSHSIVTIKNLGTVTSGSTVTTYLPNVNTDSSSYVVTTTFYYTTPDSSTKMILYQADSTYSTWSITSSPISWGIIGSSTQTPVVSATPSYWTLGNSGTITAILATTGSGSSSGSIPVGYFIGVGLSTGWTTTSSSTIGISSYSPASSYTGSGATFTSAATSYISSSNSDTSKGGFIIGKVTSSPSWGSISEGTPGSYIAQGFSLQLTNLIPPNRLSADPDTSSSFAFWVAAYDTNAACTYYSSANSNANAAIISLGTIYISSFTPTIVKAAGPDSSDTSLTVTFSLTHAVPAGGVIILTFYTDWGWKASSSYLSCSCFSLTALSKDIPLCSPNSSAYTLTLQNFNAISAGTSLTVQLDHILPPSSNAILYLVKSIYSYASASTSGSSITPVGYIDKYVNAGGDTQVIVTTATPAGTTSGMGVTAYPNVAGQIADLLFTFIIPYALPKGGSLTIATPSGLSWLYAASFSIQDYCWVDAGTGNYYTSCEVSSSSQITLVFSSALTSETIINIYLDSAITVPTTMSSGFIAAATWASLTLFKDTSAGVKFTPGASISAQITLNSPTISESLNQAEIATYSFSFASGAAVSYGDYFVIRFPRNFDPYLGDATVNYQTTPNTWYIPCSSTALGTISCTVDHWQLYVIGASKTLITESMIDLTVSKIRNPYTSSLGSEKFRAFHYNKSNALKAYAPESGSVNTLSPGSLAILKSVASANTELSASSSYNFDFYVNTNLTVTPSHAFSIDFPKQFNLQLSLGSTTPCSTSYYDESNVSGVDPTDPVNWNSATSCTISGQSIVLSVPSNTSSVTFKANVSRIRISFSTLSNPQSALKTRDATTGWDVQDAAEFGSFSSWSNKFEVIITDTSSKSVVGRSYGILHSGYLGYTVGTNQVGIGSSSTNSSNSSSRIILLPGEQSGDITISYSDKWPMMSKKVILTPSSNPSYPDSGNLKYTSAYHQWTIFQMCPSLTFRVSASSLTVNGIYYIDWKIAETMQEGVSASRYSAPASMLVEVNSAYSTLPTITVGKIPSLYPGYKSLPISITLSNAPASDMTISISLDSASSIASVSPTSLKFGPDINTLYFKITIGSGFASSTTAPKLSFSLSGTDKAIYPAIATQTLTIITTTLNPTAATVSLSKKSTTGSSITITATTSENAVLYWGIGCQGNEIPSFAALAGEVDLLNPSTSTLSFSDQLAADYAATETDPNTSKGDSDIYSFFRRKHREHCDEYWVSSQVVSYGATDITFDWLMGGTTYTITAFADNKLINNTSTYTAVTINITTSDLPPIQSISVSFEGTIDISSGENIRKTLAKNMGVNPAWLTDQTVTSSRLLADTTSTITKTTFTYNVIFDRSKPSYTPASILTNFDASAATAELTKLVGAPTYGTTSIVSTETVPTWSTDPSLTSKTNTTAVFAAASSQIGKICTSCTIALGGTTYAWQVVDGLDSTSSAVPSACVDVGIASQSVSLTVSNLSAGTTYNCYFTACNSYPMWSGCIDISSTVTSLKSIKVKTSGSSSADTLVIMKSGILAAILLIFN